jgi:hypothetical protein
LRLQDHGVPFNFEDLRLRQANGELSTECYESAIFRLEKEIEELRQGGARVRSAAVIIAEDIGLPGVRAVRGCVRRMHGMCVLLTRRAECVCARTAAGRQRAAAGAGVQAGAWHAAHRACRRHNPAFT